MFHLNSSPQSRRPTFSKIFKSEIMISQKYVPLKLLSSESATEQYSTASRLGASLDRRFWVNCHFDICHHYLNHGIPFFRSWKWPCLPWRLWCLGRALPCEQEWVGSSENVPESQQELNLCRIRGDHWPTSVEVVGNRSRGGRCGHRWFSFLAQVELAAYHDSQFVTCVARFLIRIKCNCKIKTIQK